MFVLGVYCKPDPDERSLLQRLDVRLDDFDRILGFTTMSAQLTELDFWQAGGAQCTRAIF